MPQPPLPIITLRGTAYERGYQHGSQAGERIGLAIDIYLRHFDLQAGLAAAQVRRAAGRFVPAIERFDRELLAELHGLADGARRPLEDIVALNARNELLQSGMVVRAVKDGGGSAKFNFLFEPECTAVAILPSATCSGHTLLAQNLDWKTSVTASAIVLEIVQEDERRPSIATVTEAGTLARAGLNAAGLGLCVNFLNSRASSANRLGWAGVPTQLLRRSILNAWTFGDAVGPLYQVERCIASNYLVAHADGEALDFETAPEGIGRVEPAGGLLVHSNHFVSAWGRAIDTGIAVFPDSLWRIARLERRLRPRVGQIDVADLMAALRDHT
ncbi:MAG: acyl-CoA--6-aminopenicillanic acid acyltransferase, partial [Chloroflexi bacterium]|nr:acyl-CoA--6-aminopenicillanic acid acyltransferase [Chloroflexota bacterium]